MRSLCAPVALSFLVGAALAGCSVTRREPPPESPAVPVPAAPSGPRAQAPPPPPDWMSIPDAVPRAEPRSRYGNPKFYDVFGQRYYVSSSSVGYFERGVASWYGPGFHAVRTSIGESYDMYGMSAAHKTLPLPTYVRVTNLENGRSCVVRVNDRGPFVDNRIIDLSYTAAAKLDMLRKGTAMVEVRAIDFTDIVSTSNAPVTVDTKTQPLITPAPPLNSTVPDASTPTGASTPTAASPLASPSPIASPPTAAAVGAPAKRKPLFAQAGAFASRASAEGLATKMRGQHLGTVFVKSTQAKGKTLYRVRVGPIATVAEFDRISAALSRVGVRHAQIALDD